MIERNLVVLLPPRMTPHHRGRRVTAGMFGVAKKGTTLSRVIIDRRSQNGRERSMRDIVLARALEGSLDVERAAHLLRTMTLPYAAQFTKLLMCKSSRLALTTEDAADYYYHLRLPLAAYRTNCVGPLLDSRVLEEGSPELQKVLAEARSQWGDHDVWSVCLVAPPMGDQKAPDIAQCVHMHLGWQAGALSEATCMSHGYRAPPGPIWIGAYVDDYAQVAVLDDRLPAPWSSGEVSKAADERHQKMLAAYRNACIERKVAKATKDEESGTIWGATLDSKSRTVSADQTKRRLLVMATLAI
eukprot:6476678-Amphidinium_carterae.1